MRTLSGNSKGKGFTLIELLVVIAIIALLLAILMPALKKAKKIARNVVDRSNISTLALGFRMYTETNNQKGFAYNSGALQNLWLLEIADQVGDLDKIRYCPETKIISPTKAPFTWPNGIGNAEYTWAWPYNSPSPGSVTPETAEYGSYATNWWLYSDRTDAMAWRTVNPPNSANVPVFADCKWIDFIPQNNQPCPADMDLNEGGGVQSILAIVLNRHDDQVNIGFVDGHVEPIKLEMLWSLKWGKEFNVLGPQTRVGGSPIYQR